MYVEYVARWSNSPNCFWLTDSNPPMYWSGPSSCVWIVPGTVDIEGNILIEVE